MDFTALSTILFYHSSSEQRNSTRVAYIRFLHFLSPTLSLTYFNQVIQMVSSHFPPYLTYQQHLVQVITTPTYLKQFLHLAPKISHLPDFSPTSLADPPPALLLASSQFSIHRQVSKVPQQLRVRTSFVFLPSHAFSLADLIQFHFLKLPFSFKYWEQMILKFISSPALILL